MPRYHFNVFDGYSTVDTEGTELPDWQAARREAIRLAGLILADEADKLLLGEGWKLEVTDPTGLILFRLDFCFSASSAVADQRVPLSAIASDSRAAARSI